MWLKASASTVTSIALVPRRLEARVQVARVDSGGQAAIRRSGRETRMPTR